MKKGMLFEALVVLMLLLLVFIMYMAVTTSTRVSSEWALSGVVGSMSESLYGNMFTGNNGTIYTVDGKNVNAIDQEGHIQWSLAIPYLLNGLNVEKWAGEQIATDNGTLYIELWPANGYPVADVELLAISPQGRLLWGKGYVNTGITVGVNAINAKAGQLYAQTSNSVAVYNGDGVEIWQVDDINQAYKPAIADDGSLYVLKNNTIVAYSSNGGLKWGNDINKYDIGDLTADTYNQAVLYDNHTIYVPLRGGLIALNEDGSAMWNKTYNTSIDIFWDAPFDEEGNLYLRDGSSIFHISPNGTESAYVNIFYSPVDNEKVSAEDGIIYRCQIVPAVDASSPGYPTHSSVEDALINGKMVLIYDMLGNRSIDQLDTYRIDAYSMDTGDKLWNYTLPLIKHNVTISESNYENILPEKSDIEKDNMMSPEQWYSSRNITYGTEVINSWAFADLMPAKGLLYVNFWSYNYEVPTFFNRSNCTYAGGVYAIDRNGSLIWSKSTDSRVTSMQEINGTIYYGTNNGRISATRIDAIAEGFALTATFYLFIRFFLAGAVTRARGRIDSNKNRNTVLKFIAGNPGVSLYDISKDLKMNMGTVRYHLMILGINHRVMSYKADEKYVRYFTSAGSYTKEQQFIISLIRRDSIKKVIGKLLERPGISNLELAEELGAHDSATIRYTKELLEKGIVIKDRTYDGKLVYRIKDEYKEQIALALERIDQ